MPVKIIAINGRYRRGGITDQGGAGSRRGACPMAPAMRLKAGRKKAVLITSSREKAELSARDRRLAGRLGRKLLD